MGVTRPLPIFQSSILPVVLRFTFHVSRPMQKVFVLDQKKNPLMPTHPARARQLLKRGRAVVHKRAPFTIRLKDREGGDLQPVLLKIAPDASTTGIAIIREGDGKAEVLHLAELHHQSGIREKMVARRNYRHRRRSANLRYRPRRFSNRVRKAGWLPPSMQSPVDQVTSWVLRYRRLVPIRALSVETARFDPQKFQNPATSDVEYQKGKLAGDEVRAFLETKWGKRCAYCGAKGVRLQVEHIIPESRGGTNRIANLTLACAPCNRRKGSQTAAEFGYPEISAKASAPIPNADACGRVRWVLYRAMKATGLPVEIGTRPWTHQNRLRLKLSERPALKALCVGTSTPKQLLGLERAMVLSIGALGRGQYKRTNVDKYGFPRSYLPRQKRIKGFMTGDWVKANVPQGKYAGTSEGTVLVRTSGYFDIRKGGARIAQGVNAKYLTLIQRFDGYAYALEKVRTTSARTKPTPTRSGRSWRRK